MWTLLLIGGGTPKEETLDKIELMVALVVAAVSSCLKHNFAFN